MSNEFQVVYHEFQPETGVTKPFAARIVKEYDTEHTFECNVTPQTPDGYEKVKIHVHDLDVNFGIAESPRIGHVTGVRLYPALRSTHGKSFLEIPPAATETTAISAPSAPAKKPRKPQASK